MPYKICCSYDGNMDGLDNFRAKNDLEINIENTKEDFGNGLVHVDILIDGITSGQDGIHSIEKVKDHLEKLELAVTSDDQRRCLQSLLQTCVPDTDSADERTPEKTAFQQIYD